MEQGKRTENKLNLLLISVSAPPRGSSESLQVSKYLKYLSTDKINISLVTGHLPKSQYGWHKMDPKYLAVEQRLAQVIRLPVYLNRYWMGLLRRINSRYYQRPDNERLFSNGWQQVINQLHTPPEMIYSRSMPLSSHVMALKMHHHYRIPWIMHLSDPWTLSPLLKLNGQEKEYHVSLEQQCFKYADRICFTSQEQIEIYIRQYPKYREKFEWFPNTYDDDDIAAEPIDFTGSCNFVHTGNLYGAGRDPGPLFNAINRLDEEEPGILEGVNFIFAGFHEQSIPHHRVGHLNVHFKGSLSVDEVIQLQRSSAMQIILDLEISPEEAVFFPSKTLDYLASRRPILAVTPTGSSLYKYLQGKYGTCFTHQNIEGIKNHIRQTIQKFRQQDRAYFQMPLPDKTYAASVNADRLARLLLEVMGD